MMMFAKKASYLLLKDLFAKWSHFITILANFTTWLFQMIWQTVLFLSDSSKQGLGIGIYLLIHKCQGAIIHKDLFASITLRIKALVAFDGICQWIAIIQEDYRNKNLKNFLFKSHMKRIFWWFWKWTWELMIRFIVSVNIWNSKFSFIHHYVQNKCELVENFILQMILLLTNK